MFYLVSEKLDQMTCNSPGHVVRGRIWWDLVPHGGLHNRNNLFRINRDGVNTTLVVHFQIWVWFPERWVHGHVYIVNTLERRRSRVNLNNHFITDCNEFWRTTDRGTWDDRPVLFNGRCLDYSIIKDFVVFSFPGVEPVCQILREHGQMFIKELNSTLVNCLCNGFPYLMRGSLNDHVVFSPTVFLWTSRSSNKKVESQLPL
uniref:YBL03.20 protein n=1 Tax=Saccharomyces cerevisiae TaxID=4932 RepID=E9PA34_YEASX|nr:YBL03.20 [Saccharomyces cerevisiae]